MSTWKPTSRLQPYRGEYGGELPVPRRVGVMERHRCARCRNPIRRQAVSASSDVTEAWFHPDCWAAVLSEQQRQYHQQIQAQGLDALIAPYVLAAPAKKGDLLFAGVPAQAAKETAADASGDPAEVVNLDKVRDVEGQVPEQKGRTG
jgi:hypothetical protein